METEQQDVNLPTMLASRPIIHSSVGRHGLLAPDICDVICKQFYVNSTLPIYIFENSNINYKHNYVAICVSCNYILTETLVECRSWSVILETINHLT